MTIQDLRDLLDEYPSDALVCFPDPVEGDCENSKLAMPEAFFYDKRSNFLILFP